MRIAAIGTWRELTTVYHEGVPGHHLQVGIQTLQADTLNRWRAMLCWVSGHGEGWALYAERLMAELGWLDDAGNRIALTVVALVNPLSALAGALAEAGWSTYDYNAHYNYRLRCGRNERLHYCEGDVFIVRP